MIRSVKQAYSSQNEHNYHLVRDYGIVEIRKASRQQQFQKARHERFQGSSRYDQTFYKFDQSSQTGGSGSEYEQKVKAFIGQNFSVDMLPSLLANLQSDNMMDVHIGLIGIRKLLCLSTPPIAQIIHLQIDEIILQLATSQALDEMIKFEIAWCFMNITFSCSQQINSKLVDKGLIKILLNFLSSDRIETIETAMFGITNLAADSAEIKLKLLQQNGIGTIIQGVMEKFQSQKAIQIACNGIASFYFGEKLNSYESLDNGIRLVACMFENDCIADPDVIYACLYAIFQHCILSKKDQQFQSIITQSFLTKLLPCLTKEHLKLVNGTLRNIGNYIAYFQKAVDMLIPLGIFEYIEKCLEHSNHSIRKQACWILSNMALSSKEVFIQQKMISKVLVMLFQDTTSIKREIIYLLANISLTCGSSYRIDQFLIQREIFNVMMEMLKLDDVSIVLSVLKNLYRMLNYARNRNKEDLIKNELEKGDIRVIEDLQLSESNQVFKQASKILTKFFECDIDQRNQNT